MSEETVATEATEATEVTVSPTLAAPAETKSGEGTKPVEKTEVSAPSKDGTAETQTVADVDESKDFETFTDPKDLPPELMTHYKRMQGSFTKKMQSIKGDVDKIALVNQFNSDPRGTLNMLNQQYGVNQQPNQGANQNAEQAGEFTPAGWDDVFGEFDKRIESYVNTRFSPVMQQVQGVQQKQIETILDDEAPEWREYEGDMIDALATHPTLANDTKSLIRMVIPQTVIDGRAMQKALARIEAKGQSAQVSRATQTNQPVTSSPLSNPTFAQAINAAKKSLA
jgi:hypothetical protein